MLNKLDIKQVKLEFPTLQREIRPGIAVTYLDSSATSQKPNVVIQAMDSYYRNSNANIHRGVHFLAEEATSLYEQAREKIAAFINARSVKEIIFTRNTTESINLVAWTWARKNLNTGDRVVLTEMEHHSNLVPWQMLAEEKGIILEFIPVSDEGLLDLEVYEELLSQSPRLVSFTHMSNVLGTISPAKLMIDKAHQAGAVVLLDAAQSVPHFKVDVQDLDADFLAFSGHKMLGPTGIGVLYGKTAILEAMPPFLGGGDMIRKVQLRSFSTNEIPYKFEAGTPAIAEVIGLGAAVDFLENIGMDKIEAHEYELTSYALQKLQSLKGIQILGPSDPELKGGVLSFSLDYAHPHDVAQILDMEGIAVRAGHHCAMPLHQRYNLPASTRASFYLYNDSDDIDKLVNGLSRVEKMFGS